MLTQYVRVVMLSLSVVACLSETSMMVLTPYINRQRDGDGELGHLTIAAQTGG